MSAANPDTTLCIGRDVPACLESAAAIGVLEPHDVVLAQITTGLHFDDFERDLAGVGEAVAFAYRDEGGFVLGEQEGSLPARDLRGAAHDDPVLGAVMMHLQAQRGAGIDDDALDLEALA